jgi:PAS domain S-box-containing protein
MFVLMEINWAERGLSSGAEHSDARLSAIFDNAPVGLSEISHTGRLLRVNDELCRILGRSHEDLLTLTIAELTHPDDLPETLAMVRRVLAGEIGGAESARDKRYIRPDGTIVWATSRATRLPGHDSQPGNLLVVTVDVSDRKAAERAVQESEARFRQFGDASSDALWIRNAETLEWEYLSAAFHRIYGVDRALALKSPGTGFLSDLILPEDRQATLDAIRRLRDGPGEYAYRIRRPSDGETRWLRTTGFRLVDSEGIVRRLGGITFDMTEEKHTADRMEVLVAELQHRTRNLIGVVRAIASRTLKSCRTLEEFRPRFDERLEALARVNGLLSRLEEGERVTFDELLHAELGGHGLVDDDRLARQVTLDGPVGVRLPSAAVQTLALALHELLTNAEKHGALKRPEGRLVITWRLIEDGEVRLRVEWLETGIAGWQQRPGETGGSGYGRELIERALPYQLGAETSYQLDDTRLRCVIVMPIAKREGRGGHD